MDNPSQEEVTGLLIDWSHGSRAAFDRLVPLVYGELRRIAKRQLNREQVGHTLQATALVHEAYVKLIDQRRVTWQSRAHFFGVAAQAMRRILVDHARKRDAAKRGAGDHPLSLEDAGDLAVPPQVDILALDDALTRLAALDGQQSRIVELRFFAGMTVDEIAQVLEISRRTVDRDWSAARAWLYGQMTRGAAE